MLLYTYIANATNHTQNLGASIIGVFGALVLAFLALASPGALEELSFGPFRVRWRLSQVESRVDSIQMAINGLLNRHQRSHLKKLAGEYDDRVDYRSTMVDELEDLQDLGYLKPRFGLPSVSELDKEMKERRSFHLTEFFVITKMGREYLRLYKESTLPIKVSSTREVKVDGKSFGKADDWSDVVALALDAGWVREPNYEDVDWPDSGAESLKPKE
ncbi:hypothetical protein [Streptomyces naphthomycinicus]|uniref:hypothetical protein n=1 Tax=Streptomyces naphthomycinicus TaxID=2872625 RepID=UPI001CED9A45|nr:hypothetical protein [Streptomyces sp. TML10]